MNSIYAPLIYLTSIDARAALEDFRFRVRGVFSDRHFKTSGGAAAYCSRRESEFEAVGIADLLLLPRAAIATPERMMTAPIPT